jgi:predicted ATPase/DNA-binding SARP family transcriptional activator
MPDTNLSLQLNRFVGREAELAELTVRLASNATRLVTLTGAGGIGKTRLALEAAAGRLEAYPEGVWLVELAGITEPGHVAQAVADVFELRAPPRQPVITTLTNALHHRHLLLVLDNCEHLIEACAQMAEALLRNCPQLKILATSREALGIPGEMVWPLAPLSVPNFWGWPASGADASGAVLKYEAVRLFADRAAYFAHGFTLTNQNVLAVTQICFGLDGLPLAIELAAARTRTLAVEQIAARLDDRFRLLTSGSRTALPRHQTLRAVIDWSYDLLSEAERLVFRRLAVFSNGWTVEAAEAVCAGEEQGQAAAHSVEVADGLARLVSKSLVSTEERDGAMRYRLLDTIRQYAGEKLEGLGEADAVRQQHLEFFLRFAEEADPKLRGGEQRAWSARMEAEHENLRAAWAWALPHDAAAAARLAWSMRYFWYRRGYMNEAHDWSSQLLKRTDTAEAGPTRALAFNLAGTVANWQFDHTTARAHFKQSLALAGALGDQAWEAAAWQGMGVANLGLGGLQAARTHYEQSLKLFAALGDQWRVANVLGALCAVVGGQGDYSLARQFGEESLMRYRQLGDSLASAQPLLNLGELERAQGNYAAAASYYEQCLELDTKVNQAGAWQNLGQIAVRQRQYARANQLFQASLANYREQNNGTGIALCLFGLAGVIASAGKPWAAAQLLGVAELQMETLGTAMHATDQADFDHQVALVRAALDQASFTQAWASGRKLTRLQAVELALGEATSVRPEAQTRPTIAETPTQSELVVWGLGPTRVWRGRRELVSADWRYAKSKELLFFLLCQPPQTKEQIGLALWPDASAAQLRNNLGVTLHYLRHALGRSEWIVFELEHYTFNRSLSYRFDLESFQSGLANAGRMAGEPAMRCLEETLRLYHGDFAADLTDNDWPGARREELRREYLDALLQLGSRLLGAGRHTEAAEAYRAAIAADSYLEQAHRELMRCYARLGERGQAVRHYQGLLALLREQIQAAPAPETEALYEGIRRGEAV